MTRPRRLLLISSRLTGGGAQRVTALLARNLDNHRYDVHLCLLNQANINPGLLPSSLSVHALGATRARYASFALLRLIRRLNPDLIFSGALHLNFLLLLLRPLLPHRTRVLIRQDSTPSATLESVGLPAYFRFLFRHLYPRADRIVCQSASMATDLSRVAHLPQSRIAVLPNPIDIDAIRSSVSAASLRPIETRPVENGPVILAVGRLVPAKGFHLLLHAFSRLRIQFPQAQLLIAGTGPEEHALKSLALQLHLQNAVHFLGYLDDLTAQFAKADLFVLSSRSDALPNALLEAAAAGLPIVAAPASEGVVHLLTAQPGIWLCPAVSIQDLSLTLASALSSLQPGRRFPHPFIERFSTKNSIPLYERVIESLL